MGQNYLHSPRVKKDIAIFITRTGSKERKGALGGKISLHKEEDTGLAKPWQKRGRDPETAGKDVWGAH